MAAGDFTFDADTIGNLSLHIGTVEVPSTYATGGIPLAAGSAKFGMSTVRRAECQCVSAATTVMVARYNAATDKIMLYTSNGAAPAALAELANATSLSGFVVSAMVLGKKQGTLP